MFEITERETIKNTALLDRFVADLRAEGFKLAIDDFGSGFSSFHYIKRFPIDFLKIEGDFIRGLRNDEKDRTLVRSIVSLAQELGIRTVAEYVEDQAVLDQVGDPALGTDAVADVQEVLVATGALAAVEREIDALAAQAVASLATLPVEAEVGTALTELAAFVVARTG